jgi:hypothetical protein
VDAGEDGEVVLLTLRRRVSAVSKDGGIEAFIWFETREVALLTMRSAKIRSLDERSEIRGPVLDCFPDFASLIRATI